MPVRFLDLDPIRQAIGTFQFEGVTYTVWPMRLQQLINLQAHQVQGDQADIRTMLAIVHDTIPDCPPEVLERLDVPQLNALTAWSQQTGEDAAAKNSEAPSPPETTATP